MYRRYLPVCLLVLTALAACTNHDAQECVSDQECRAPRVCMAGECGERPQVEVPQEYDRFMRSDAQTHVSRHTRFPESSSDAFHVYLFLKTDGSAHVFYEEGFLGHGFNRYQEFTDDRPDTRTRIDTRWSVDEGRLMVGDVLRCEDGEFAEEPVLECELLRPVYSEEAVGAVVPLAHDDLWSEIPDDATLDHEALSEFRPE